MKPMILKYRLIFIFLFAFIFSSFTDQNPKKRSSEWQTLYSTTQLEIKYRYAECKLPSMGMHNENVYLQVVNKTNERIKVEWNVEYWYNEKCNGCNSVDNENYKSIVIKPNETLEGSCSEQCSKELVLFSKMLNSEAKSVLTDFNLRDLKVTTILN
jgi:hypothetical protein